MELAETWLDDSLHDSDEISIKTLMVFEAQFRSYNASKLPNLGKNLEFGYKN